jgi:hypothetical protein
MKNLGHIQVNCPIQILYEDTFSYLVMINDFIHFTACLGHTEHCLTYFGRFNSFIRTYERYYRHNLYQVIDLTVPYDFANIY